VILKGTRYGEVVEPGIPSAAEVNAGIPDARDIPIHSDWLVDFAFNAKLLEDKLAFTLGVDNLFDQYPDRVPIARVLPTPPGGVVNLDATNATAYSRYSPYGFNGRFVYARMSFNW
jgi:iron complex outermembrane receptor protein